MEIQVLQFHMILKELTNFILKKIHKTYYTKKDLHFHVSLFAIVAPPLGLEPRTL